MLIYSVAHLVEVLSIYATHYNTHRPHQSRRQRPPAVEANPARPVTDLDLAPVRRTACLGGLLNEYSQAA
jgi:hypothetical protein